MQTWKRYLDILALCYLYYIIFKALFSVLLLCKIQIISLIDKLEGWEKSEGEEFIIENPPVSCDLVPAEVGKLFTLFCQLYNSLVNYIVNKILIVDINYASK